MVGGKVTLRGPARLDQAETLPAAAIVALGREQRDYLLAVETRLGWYLLPLAEGQDWIAVDTLARRALVAGGPEVIVLDYTGATMTADDPDGRWFQVCSRELVVCGAGPSGAPGCVRSGELGSGTCEDDAAEAGRIDWNWTSQVSFEPDGAIHIERGADAPHHLPRRATLRPRFP